MTFPIDPQGREWSVGEDADGNYVLTVILNGPVEATDTHNNLERLDTEREASND